MKCPRCGDNKFWNLSTGQKRCSQCGLTRKFEKTLWQLTIISPYWKGRLLEFFCLDLKGPEIEDDRPEHPNKKTLRVYLSNREKF